MGSGPTLPVGLFQVESCPPVATLLGALRVKVGAGTGWPDVSNL